MPESTPQSQPTRPEINPQASSSATIFSRLGKLASTIAWDYIYFTENALEPPYPDNVIASYIDEESYLASATIGVLRKYLQEGALEKNILFGGAGDLAKQHPRHACHLRIGPRNTYVMLGAADLKQIFERNADKVSRHEAVKENFSKGFGNHNVFTAENGKDHQLDQRNAMKDRVFLEKPLAKVIPIMQEIIKGHVKEAAEGIESDAKKAAEGIESHVKEVAEGKEAVEDKKAAEDNSVDLEDLCTSITLDMIAILHLGATESISHLNKELTEHYEELLVQLFDLNNLARRILSGLKNKISFGYIPDNSGKELLEAKAKVEEFIKKNIIDVFKENILANDTLLKDWAGLTALTENEKKELKENIKELEEILKDERKEFSENIKDKRKKLEENIKDKRRKIEEELNSPQLLEKLSMILLAGHDSTGRLLQAALMLLATHPAEFEKLRKAIDGFFAQGLSVNRENITTKIPELNDVILEALRLFPSAPILGYEVTKEFTIGNLPDDYKDFKEAWDARDKTKDITFQPGDMIIASPYKTHEVYFENPREFIPERWKGKESLNNLNHPKIANYFPFGLGLRSCIGFKFGLQEALLTLMEIVRNYDIKMIPTNDKDPFEITAIGTLRFKNNVRMTFESRLDKPENVKQNDVKDQKQEEVTEEPLNQRRACP